MVAKGGKKLINEPAIKILKNNLLSKADLITPNIPEAEVLTNSKISSIQDVILAGNHLIEWLSINLVPPLATITGSKIIFFTFILFKDFNTALITFVE